MAASSQSTRASMGPRSTDRGNVLQETLERGLWGKLQWGRDRLIAEIAWRRTETNGLARLQWGRDRLIAEIFPGPVLGLLHRKLQWGRDRLIAEMLDALEGRFGPDEASMGPRSTDRGNSTLFTGLQQGLAGFNGAAID